MTNLALCCSPQLWTTMLSKRTKDATIVFNVLTFVILKHLKGCWIRVRHFLLPLAIGHNKCPRPVPCWKLNILHFRNISQCTCCKFANRHGTGLGTREFISFLPELLFSYLCHYHSMHFSGFLYFHPLIHSFFSGTWHGFCHVPRWSTFTMEIIILNLSISFGGGTNNSSSHFLQINFPLSADRNPNHILSRFHNCLANSIIKTN